MKMIGLIVSFILTFQFLEGGNHNQLLKMVEVASNHNITITNWKVYIKQPVISVRTKEEVKEEVLQIMDAHPSYKWESKDAKHHYSKVGYKKNQLTDMNERMTITVYNAGTHYKINTSFEIKGGKWNNLSWEFLQATYKDDLEKNIAYFTVYGTKEIIKNLDLEEQASKMLTAFSAIEVEGMKEKNFISLSAYVNEWEMEIPTKNKEVFNLQFGLRVDPGGKYLNVAIGTPLITSGY